MYIYASVMICEILINNVNFGIALVLDVVSVRSLFTSFSALGKSQRFKTWIRRWVTLDKQELKYFSTSKVGNIFENIVLLVKRDMPLTCLK